MYKRQGPSGPSAGGALGAGAGAAGAAAAAGGAEGAGAGAGTTSSSENRRGAGQPTCFARAFNSAAAGDAGRTGSSLMGDGGGRFVGFGESAFRSVQGPSYPE